jgi:hypothetical protein
MLHIKVERVVVYNPWFRRFIFKLIRFFADLAAGLEMPSFEKVIQRVGIAHAISTSAPASLGTPFNGMDQGQKLIYVFGTITPAAQYAAGGDTWDLTKMSWPDGSGGLLSGYAPVGGSVTAQSNSAANGHSGFQYYYRPGNPATISNGRFQVLQSNGTLLVDIGAGAYPAAVLADTIVFAAAFVRA